MVAPMLAWSRVASVVSLSFEDVLGDAGPSRQAAAIASLAMHLGVPLPPDPEETIARILNTDTLTWSGERSRRDRYWSRHADEFLERDVLGAISPRLRPAA
jgi:hypothetical protein